MRKGYFITFEGIEGSGKSTLIKGLINELKNRHIDFLVTREPGDVNSKITKDIKKLIYKYNDLTSLAEAFLFQADRAYHVEKIIKPNLNKGKLVICDRFIDSSVVYQGILGNVSRETIEELNHISTKSLLPNLTILLDIDPKIAIKRITQNNRETNKFDLKDLNFHKKVAKAYLSLANESKRFAVFDANKSIDELKSEVLSYILKKIKFF